MFRAIVLRLASFNASVIALILLLAGVATYLTVNRSLSNDIDNSLVQSMGSISAHTLSETFHQNVNWVSGGTLSLSDIEEEEHERETLSPALPIGGAIVIGSDRTVLYPSTLQGVAAGTVADTESVDQALAGNSVFGNVTIDEARYRTFVKPVYGQSGVLGVVQVAQSDEPRLQALSTMRSSMLLVGLAGIVAAIAGGALLSARGLRPVREAFNRQRAFIADASHQLKTPVAIVRADAETLDRSLTNLRSEDAELLRDLVDSSGFLSDLVNQLLVVARMEGEQRAPEHTPVDLGALADEAVANMRHLAERRGIKITSSSPSSPVVVSAAETQIKLGLLALIDNAIKYNVPEGSVAVTVDRDGDWGRVTVADTGVGIDEDDQARIWERFFRSADSRASSIDGAGLGLPIIKEIVRQHHGRILLSSHKGKGTTVAISLRVLD